MSKLCSFRGMQIGKTGSLVPKFPCWNTVFCMKQWQAMVLPLALTSLMYAGSLFLKSLLLLDFMRHHTAFDGGLSFDSFKCASTRFIDWLSAISSNVLTWRNYVVVSTIITIVFVVNLLSSTCHEACTLILSSATNESWNYRSKCYLMNCEFTWSLGDMCFTVRFHISHAMQHGNLLLWYTEQAPLTEELVFRACMIPILFCGGFKAYSAMILCPIFFSLGKFFDVNSRNCIWYVRLESIIFCSCVYMRIYWPLALIVQKCSRQLIKIRNSTISSYSVSINCCNL